VRFKWGVKDMRLLRGACPGGEILRFAQNDRGSEGLAMTESEGVAMTKKAKDSESRMQGSELRR